MVIAEQVECGMYGKERKLTVKGMSVFLRLRFCTFHGNDDIADGSRSFFFVFFLFNTTICTQCLYHFRVVCCIGLYYLFCSVT